MEIFCRLLFGHLLADFTFQTNFLAEWKRKSLLGLFVHVIIHPICYILLLWPYLSMVWANYFGLSLTGYSCILIATVLHYIEDWFRVRQINLGWSDNTFFYVWDQVVHIFVLVLISPIKNQSLEHVWPLLGCIFVLVTHCATVTVWFIEKDIFGRQYPETEEKYIAILQRLIVWLAFFLPYPWWIVVVAILVLAFMRHVWIRRVDFSWTSVIMGNLIAIACGAISRFVLQVHF